MTTPESGTASAEASHLFDRILVEIDETPESLIAAAQAKWLAAAGGELEFLAVVERGAASQAGVAGPLAAGTSERETAAALEHARRLFDPTTVRTVAARARDALLDETARVGATLVAVGMHPHRRLTARLFGTLDAAALRDAPCSVLVARPGWGSAGPRRIVVGVDGSEGAAQAERVGRELGDRLGAEVQVVIALGGKRLDDSVYAPENAEALFDPRDPPLALGAAASEGDLVVIGERGAHGARGLGRVGERAVYAARSSVLVVRAPQQA